MDSPAKKKTTTAFATPKKNASTPLAMDITRDNRVVYNLDNDVFIAARTGEPLPAWKAHHMKGAEKDYFSPSRIMLEDHSRRTLLLNEAAARRHQVALFDTERGTNVRDIEVKNMLEDIDMSIRTLTPAKKFAQLHDSPSVVREYGVADNMVFTVHNDLREKNKVVVVKEKDKSEVKAKGLNYTAVVANHDGDVAVGTSNGEIKLYENPEAGWTKVPKNSFTQLAAEGHAVTGLDVSYDGEWLLWTTHDKIALLNLAFKDPKTGLNTTAFKTRWPEELRNSAMVLTLSKEEMEKHGIARLNFTPAKFDASTSIVETTHARPDSRQAHEDQDNMLELSIVSSTGSHVVSWNFRRVRADYKKLNKTHEGRLETTVRPTLTTLSSHIMATQCEYYDAPSSSESVVVAATEEALSRLSLAH